MTVLPIHFLGAYGTHTSKPVVLVCGEELTTYSRWVRGTIREFLHFSARLIASKTPIGQSFTIDVEKEPFVAHSYGREDGLVIVVITFRDYPVDIVQRLLFRAARRYPDGRWMLDTVDNKIPDTEYQELMARFQDPTTVDSLRRVQAKIEEVKTIAVVTLDKLLAREETLESLVAKTDDLSEVSKKFYSRSEDLSGCCWKWFGWRRHRLATD